MRAVVLEEAAERDGGLRLFVVEAVVGPEEGGDGIGGIAGVEERACEAGVLVHTI